jgi:microcompartment protein CcmK/EutM
MLLGRVVGTVVATRKDQELEGLRFMVVQVCDFKGEATGQTVVAADAVGAGEGEVVLFASGSSARQTVQTHQRPCDATIMAIVDVIEVGGKAVYDKVKDHGRAAARGGA